MSRAASGASFISTEKSLRFPHLPLPKKPLKPPETFIAASCLILKTSTTLNMLFRTLLPAEQVLQKVNDSVLPPAETNTRKESRSFELIDPELESDYAEVVTEPPLSEGGADPGDPFDPGPVDPKREPDLYPPLTPVKAPMAEEILQQQRQKTLSRLSLMRPPRLSVHPPPSAPPSPPSYPLQGTVQSKISGGLLDECRTEALKRGDISLLQAMPVLYQPNRPPEYAHLPYDVIKEVRKSIKEYGLQASFTMNLLQVIGESYVLTPLDWKSILRLVLSAAQYSVWFLEYRELVQVQVMNNLTAGTAIGLDELMGEGHYATGIAQAGLSRNVLTQATGLALRALRRVPDFGKRESSFASIRQGPQEPYVQFLDRLQTAIQRQIESSEAAELLLFQLAIENANMDCRRAIDPIHNQAKTLNDLIRACQNVGSEQHKADMLAAALAQQLVVARAATKCFSCGQEGHVKKDCPKARRGGRGQGGQGRQLARLCPRCQKGYHWGPYWIPARYVKPAQVKTHTEDEQDDKKHQDDVASGIDQPHN
ncbi:endogenous retrovirus group K member 6 Gag polyprotein-like [Grus japonensis]|uniref:Gag polyprotein n=1 Tax=Grus japonensis TaxID=30415 RepID=A0ABC9Y8R2_GRUJA